VYYHVKASQVMITTLLPVRSDVARILIRRGNVEWSGVSGKPGYGWEKDGYLKKERANIEGDHAQPRTDGVHHCRTGVGRGLTGLGLTGADR
jgi:hypothetical protein